MAKSVKLVIFAFAIILWCLFAGPTRAEELVISEEFSSESQFTTALETIVSEELSFQTATTTSVIPVDLPVVSDELSFKTVDEPVNPSPPGDGGGGTGGGGGGGGGSSGGFGTAVTPLVPSLPIGQCPIYLTKFIRFGADNDSNEVRQLQTFLRDYEGFGNLLVTGIYDQATLAAVMVFQTRYADAILKPWGIDYPTGYVYITTTLAINNLYCERDPANDLDLRIRRGEIVLPSIAVPDGRPATSTATTTLPEVGQLDRNFFQLAAVGLLDFIKNHPWWWALFLIALILMIIFGSKKRKEDS